MDLGRERGRGPAEETRQELKNSLWLGVLPRASGCLGQFRNYRGLVKNKLQPPDFGWVAQVSILRPGFLLRNRSYRNTQDS